MNAVILCSTQKPVYNFINFYACYVDNTVISFSGSSEELNKMHECINRCYRTVNVSLEIEWREGILHYQDHEIRRVENSHRFGTPVQFGTDILILKDSFQHVKYKTSNLRRRSLLRCHIMLNTWQEFQGKGFQEALVGRLVERRDKKRVRREMNPSDTGKGTKPYLGRVSETISRILKKIGVDSAFVEVADRLSKTKGKIDHLDLSGVYRASCPMRESAYVGQTGRKMRTRAKVHLKRKDSAVKNFPCRRDTT